MSAIYLMYLIAMSVAVLAVVLEATYRVLRPFTWITRTPHLHRVDTTDRRIGVLPFVGRDRRSAGFTIDTALAYAEVRRGA
jgi:hypothetical protein